MASTPPSDDPVEQLLKGEPALTAGRLAHRLNLLRAAQRVTRTRVATRSTMLWALMSIDDGVAEAFRAAGVDLAAWTRILDLAADPGDIPAELDSRFADSGNPPKFHADLVEAIDQHLPRYQVDDGPPSAADLALAILDSIETGRSNVLGGRLDELGFDRGIAVEHLEQAPTQSIDLEEFSPSVRHVIDRIGLATAVTPSRFAAELADLHPDYAGGLLGTVDFSGDEGVPYPLADILATVRHLAGNRAEGQVIHTRDTLVHLASFHDHVRSALEANGAYRELVIELGAAPTQPSPDRPTLDMLADIPIDDPEFDVMNFSPYVDAVVQLIENPRTTTPLSIAINGPWGSGKTSLGRMVETRLKRNREDRLVPIVSWFNAWLHDSADDLGAALTAHIGREVNAYRRPWQRFLQMLPKTMLTARQRYWRKLWVTGLGLFIALTVAYGWVRVTTDGIVDSTDGDATAQTRDGDESAAGAAAQGGAWATLVLAVLAAASRYLDPARSAAAFIASPRSEAQDGALNEARDDLGRLLNQAGVPLARNMVIFVDDLERSRPPSAIDICEVANQLLDHPGVFVIYLADMAKIASTVEIKYKDYARWTAHSHRPSANGVGESDAVSSVGGVAPPCVNAQAAEAGPMAHQYSANGWWGRAYMEKMVQIQIDIPELDKAAGSDLLRLITAQSQAASSRRIDERRQNREVAWVAALLRPLNGVGVWLDDRRKRTIVERLYSLVDRSQEGGTFDADRFRAAAAESGLDPDIIGRVIERNTEESETYRAAEKLAVDYLPNNPRAIKRLANRLRFESEVFDELRLMFESDPWVDPRLVGKWAVLTTRWPSLAESLRSGRISCNELEGTDEDLGSRLKDHVRPGLEHEVDQIVALLAAEPPFGGSINQFLYHRLAPDAVDSPA